MPVPHKPFYGRQKTLLSLSSARTKHNLKNRLSAVDYCYLNARKAVLRSSFTSFSNNLVFFSTCSFGFQSTCRKNSDDRHGESNPFHTKAATGNFEKKVPPSKKKEGTTKFRLAFQARRYLATHSSKHALTVLPY